MEKSRFGLTNNQLKIIAMISMLIDHLGVGLFPAVGWMRIVGRLALPIFAYMIAEGCRYTRNRPKHLVLIAALAVGCQLVYWLAMESLYQSILVTFTLSIIVIYSVDGILQHKSVWRVLASLLGLALVVLLAVVFPKKFITHGYQIDYDIWGVLMPVVVYYAKWKPLKLVALAGMIVITVFTLGAIQWYGLCALPLLVLYNGTRGKWKLKYMFYIFYPTHLVLIYGLQLLQASGRL